MDEEIFCENYGKPDDEVYNSHYDSSAEIDSVLKGENVDSNRNDCKI